MIGRLPVRPSTVRLPERPPEGVLTLLDFLEHRFPRVPREVWVSRCAAGAVWSAAGPLAADTPFVPLLEVHYRREVDHEPPVRTDVRAVWRDADLLVVDKPPFLPVTPAGRYVRHCLLHLLEAAGEGRLDPLHRLDRLTSGLVLLSRDPSTRGHFSRLFRGPSPLVQKEYLAVCEELSEAPARAVLEHHVARSREEYFRQVVDSGLEPNARLELELVTRRRGLALVRVRPQTGRKHQIRVQLAAVGLPIVGDPIYGSGPRNEDLGRRLWLDAHRLEVDGFPGPDGEPELRADWRSRVSPVAFLEGALRQVLTHRVGGGADS